MVFKFNFFERQFTKPQVLVFDNWTLYFSRRVCQKKTTI